MHAAHNQQSSATLSLWPCLILLLFNSQFLRGNSEIQSTMVLSTRQTPRGQSASHGRYGTTGKQIQSLNFLENYDSDGSFHNQGAQPRQRPYGTYAGGEVAFQRQPRQRPFGTYDGGKIAFQKPPKQPPYGTYAGGDIAFAKKPKQRPYGTYSGGEIRFDHDEDSGEIEHERHSKEVKAYAVGFHNCSTSTHN